MAITVTSVQCNAGLNTIVPNGLIYIRGTGLTAGHMYLLYSGGAVEMTGLTWDGISIHGNPPNFTVSSDGEVATLLIVNSTGDSFSQSITIWSSGSQPTLHGFYVRNFVTEVGTTSVLRYSASSFGSYGKVTTYNDPPGTLGIRFVHIGGPNPVWSSEIDMEYGELARLNEPLFTILSKQGVINSLNSSFGS